MTTSDRRGQISRGATGLAFALAIALPIALPIGLGCGAASGTSGSSGAPPTATSSSASAQGGGPTGALPTALDDSKRALASAAATNDPRERCRLLHEAVLLDGKSLEARAAYGSSRCAPAKELVVDARALFDARPDAGTAALLATVGTRAGDKDAALTGARALVAMQSQGVDLDAARLAARTLARFGEHGEAARAWERIASERGTKGAALEALDARLEAVMESARSGGKGAAASPRADLLGAIDAASTQSAGFGAGWIGPKVVEAIGVLRAAGDVAGAADAAKAARDKKIVDAPDARHAFEIERAIAAARAGDPKPSNALLGGEKLAAHMTSAASRALLAVEARHAGKCGVARAHARAHDSIVRGGAEGAQKDAMPRLDADVAWARDCAAKGETGELVGTIAAPLASDEVDDAIAVGRLDAVRGRALLQALVDTHPDDPAARIALSQLLPPTEALSVLDGGLKTTPGELSLHRAKLDRLTGRARADEGAEIAKVVLPSTVEVYADPRAAVPVLAEILAHVPDDKSAGTSSAVIAGALLRACAAKPKEPGCVDDQGKSIESAVKLARLYDPPALSSHGPGLCDADLKAPSVRLAIVIALLDAKQTQKAEAMVGDKRGKWETPEGGLASALVAASKKDCVTARNKIAQWPGLMSNAEWAPELSRVKEACKIAP